MGGGLSLVSVTGGGRAVPSAQHCQRSPSQPWLQHPSPPTPGSAEPWHTQKSPTTPALPTPPTTRPAVPCTGRLTASLGPSATSTAAPFLLTPTSLATCSKWAFTAWSHPQEPKQRFYVPSAAHPYFSLAVLAFPHPVKLHGQEQPWEDCLLCTRGARAEPERV